MGRRASLRPKRAHDLESPRAVAGDHVRIVVRRGLDRSLPVGDLARQPVPFSGLVVAGDVIRADLRAERPRQLDLHARRRIGHDDQHPFAKPHAGECDTGREVPGGMSDHRPVADPRQVARHPVQCAEQLERADGSPPVVLQPHPARSRHAELSFERMGTDQRRRRNVSPYAALGLTNVVDRCDPDRRRLCFSSRLHRRRPRAAPGCAPAPTRSSRR